MTEITPEMLRRCGCVASTAICGCISKGTGALNFYGFWQVPCPHGNAFVPWEGDCSYHGAVIKAAEGEAKL